MRLVSVSCENLTWKRREGDGSTLSSLTCLDMPVEGASSSSSQQTHDLQIEWIQRRLASAVTVSRNVIQTSICEFENVCNCLFHCKSKIDSLRPLFCTEYRHTRRLPTLIKSTLLIARSRSTPLRCRTPAHQRTGQPATQLAPSSLPRPEPCADVSGTRAAPVRLRLAIDLSMLRRCPFPFPPGSSIPRNNLLAGRFAGPR